MRNSGKKKGKGRVFALTGIITAALIGSVLVGLGVRGEAPPPSPPVTEAVAATGPTQPSKPSSQKAPPTEVPSVRNKPAPGTARETPADLLLKRSQPTKLTIPSIDVDTDLMNVGLQADGTIGVPPLDPDAPAGWFDRGPAPGEKGPAVILGHVTAQNKEGPAVFFKLGALRKNDQIFVTRADGKEAIFTITRIVQTQKQDFSGIDTYGNTDDAQLRLITCGGTFNESTGRHADNIVVHATLSSIRGS